MKNHNNQTKNSLELLINQNKIIINELELMQFADYAIEVKYNNTILHCILCKSKEEDFTSNNLLQVNYKELFLSQDKFFNNQNNIRNYKQQDTETLIARLIDRSIRPIIAKNYFFGIQITVNVMYNDNTIMMDLLSIIAVMCLLKGSSIPLQTTIAPTRIIQNKNNSDFKSVTKLETQKDKNNQKDKIENPLLNILIVSNKNSIFMLDCEAKEINYASIIQAIEVGKKVSQILINQINKYYEEEIENPINIKLIANNQSKIQSIFYDKLIQNIINDITKIECNLKQNINKFTLDNIYTICKKLKESSNKGNALKNNNNNNFDKFLNQIDQDRNYADNILKYIKKQSEIFTAQNRIYQNKIRLDNRNYNIVRPLSMRINTLPYTHGSSIFTRGKTTSLSTILLAPTFEDENYTNAKNFIFNYEFPSFATGDIQIRNTTRREIGHSNLCFKALKPLIIKLEDFSYNIAINSMILSSDGSSSMASVCAASLALMDAGVPIKRHIAGIAMGLAINEISEDKSKIDYQVLSDINANEDYHGLMDLKIASTSLGITAIQLDVKMLDVDILILKKAFKQADLSLKKILEEMHNIIPIHNKEVNQNVPILKKIILQPEHVKEIIGQGGRNIKEIIKEFNIKIDITKNNILIIQGAKIQTEAAYDYIEKLILEMQNKKELRNTQSQFNKNVFYQKNNNPEQIISQNQNNNTLNQITLEQQKNNNPEPIISELIDLNHTKQITLNDFEQINTECKKEKNNNTTNNVIDNQNINLDCNLIQKDNINNINCNIVSKENNIENKQQIINNQQDNLNNFESIEKISLEYKLECNNQKETDNQINKNNNEKFKNNNQNKKINFKKNDKEEINNIIENIDTDISIFVNKDNFAINKDSTLNELEKNKNDNINENNIQILHKKENQEAITKKPQTIKRHIGLWYEPSVNSTLEEEINAKINNYNEIKNKYNNEIENNNINSSSINDLNNANLISEFKEINKRSQSEKLKSNEENLQTKIYKKNNNLEEFSQLNNKNDNSNNKNDNIRKIIETERKIFDF
ncbi:MAG: KH domain-containing protein [Rickettsiales bacterium]